ncbi:gamma-tubulin complex component 6-like isoform X2 [Lineus longissimus]
MTEVDKLFAHAYELRVQRRFDDANSLEEFILDLDKLEENAGSSVQNVLKLLLCLAGTGCPSAQDALGHGKQQLPVFHQSQASKAVVPVGPLNYGDTQLRRPFEQFYMQYPRQIFEMPCGTIAFEMPPALKMINSTVCESTPGSNLSTDFFMAHGLLNDTHEKRTHLSLFGALVNSRMMSLDARLDLPDLDEDAGINVPSLSKITEYTTSPDEGFETNSLTSMTIPVADVTPDEDIWELALHYVPSKHRTWENIGRVPGPTERPYLTEAGPHVFDELCKLREADIQLLDPKLRLPKRRCISMKILVRDVLYLLTGVLSKTFMFDKEKEEFYVCPGVHLSGTSPEALTQLCSELIECGTNYHRLFKFSKPPLVNSLYTQGLVFQALTGALRKYLHYYEACVLMVSHNKTVMEVNFMFNKIKPQIRFLAELCLCSMRPPSGFPSPAEEFPKGIKLLSYLYQITVDNCSSDHYPVLLSILYTSCGPYIQFIQNWAYHGFCQDIYEEFMIRVNQDFLFCRDKYYWTNGYEMVSQESEEMVPLFLKDLALDLFVCGKSINLLKLCCPEHFMCNLDEESIPRVTITFSGHDLAMLQTTCQAYISRMKQIAQQKIHTRAEIKERAERAKLDLIQKARHAAAKEMDKFQAKLKEVRRLVDAKKRQQFHELKQQMVDDLERRQQVIDKEKEEDKARIDAATRTEGEEMTEEQRLEEEAREELIAYYSKLTEEAARREQKALWKIRRHKLDKARELYLLKNEDDLEQEMQQYRAKLNASIDEADESVEQTIPTSNLLNLTVNQPASAPLSAVTRNILDMSIPNFPLSTSVVGPQVENLLDITLDQPASHGISHTDGKNLMDASLSDLPNWAQRTFPAGQEMTCGVEDSALPKWAKKGNVDPSLGAQVVVDSAEVTQEDPKNVTSTLVVLDETCDESKWNKGPSLQMDADGLPKWAQKDGPATGDGSINMPEWVREELDEVDETDSENLKIGADDTSVFGKNIDVDPAGKARTSVSEANGVVTNVRMVEGFAATLETEESESKPHIVVFEDKHALKETEQREERPAIKAIPGEHIARESEDNPMEYQYMPPQLRTPEEIYRDLDQNTSGYEIRQSRRKLKMGNLPKNILNKHVSEESKILDVKSKSANVHGHHSDETNLVEQSVRFDEVRRRKFEELNVHGHSSKESDEVVKIATRNVHGHHSQQSELRDVDAARLKKFKEQNVHGHASAQSNMLDLDTVRMMKMKKLRETNIHGHVSSETADTDVARLEKFKKRNKHGHSSDSTVQRLLYGVDKFGVAAVKDEEMSDGENADLTVFDHGQAAEEALWVEDRLEPYQDNFDIVNEPPMVDITQDIYQSPFTLWQDVDKVDNHQYMSLPVLLKKSITAPLLAQISLVNKSMVSYFYHDLEIDRHFEALRMYLFMEDGEFGQTLGEHLFEKLAQNPQPQDVLNPVFLNGVLTKALRSSIHGDSDLAKGISFVIKHVPHFFSLNGDGPLECIDLTYKVDWPMNIIITDNCLVKYGKVFTFMLQLKRTVWTLKDVWHQLIRDPMIFKARNVPQVRQLQLFRHEMQCFVKVMQGYISNQIIHVSWREFQDDLMNNVHSLDDLHHRHAEYLNKAVFRCLLNAKAAPVMKVIQDIFKLILRFHAYLTGFAWQKSATSGEITHPNFANLLATYKAFKDYSIFLFKVVNKLSARGYHQHLEEFLLRLNFNSYYTEHQPR